MKKCPKCGEAINDNAAFCGNCGEKLVESYCSHCGKPLTENENFCSNCGTNQKTGKMEKTRRNVYGKNEPYQEVAAKGVGFFKRFIMLVLILALTIVAVFPITQKEYKIEGTSGTISAYSYATPLHYFDYIYKEVMLFMGADMEAKCAEERAASDTAISEFFASNGEKSYEDYNLEEKLRLNMAVSRYNYLNDNLLTLDVLMNGFSENLFGTIVKALDLLVALIIAICYLIVAFIMLIQILKQFFNLLNKTRLLSRSGLITVIGVMAFVVVLVTFLGGNATNLSDIISFMKGETSTASAVAISPLYYIALGVFAFVTLIALIAKNAARGAFKRNYLFSALKFVCVAAFSVVFFMYASVTIVSINVTVAGASGTTEYTQAVDGTNVLAPILAPMLSDGAEFKLVDFANFGTATEAELISNSVAYKSLSGVFALSNSEMLETYSGDTMFTVSRYGSMALLVIILFGLSAMLKKPLNEMEWGYERKYGWAGTFLWTVFVVGFLYFANQITAYIKSTITALSLGTVLSVGISQYLVICAAIFVGYLIISITAHAVCIDKKREYKING